MNKLLVFTNAERWNQIKGEFFVDETRWDIPYNSIAKTQVLKYGILNGIAILKPVSNLSIKEAGVYFVYDLISESVLKQLQEQCASDNLYVLVHTTRGITCSDWAKGVHVLEGSHDTSDEHYYYPLFGKLTSVKDSDTEAGIFGEVIELLFEPLQEAILSFVNECLVPQRNLDESNAYGILYQKEELREELDEFRKKYESSKNLEEYKEDLERLRDSAFECQ